MKIKYTLFLFLISFSIFGQNRDAIYDIIAKETCECVSNKKLDLKNDNSEKIQLDFGLCIINSFSNHKNDFDEPINLDFNDSNSMGKLGEDIAMKMVHHCPDIIIALGSRDDITGTEEEIPIITLEAVFIESKKNEFLTINVKESNGRIHTMLILSYFEGISIITEEQIKKNDKIIVEYFEEEFYDPKVNDFRHYKVIQGIKKL
jgi:hypothetical protein